MANHTDPILGTQASSCPDCGALKCLCRPRFFAGQLLTEEDLNRLDRYLVEKQRLHNRHLHGWGVSCGLEVTCDPCDTRMVRVSPGYALDPCGSDIVVCRESHVPVCELIEDCRRAERTREPCGPYDAASNCPQAEETWILAIRYKENPTRGISALRRSADRCAPAQGTTPPPRGAPPQCEARILCEEFEYVVYRAPEHNGDEAREWGAMVERAMACVRGLFEGFPQAPEPVTTTIREPIHYDYLELESTEGIGTGTILRLAPGQASEELVTVDRTSGARVYLTELPNNAHDTGTNVEVLDRNTLSSLCCRVMDHFRRALESHPNTDCRLLERLNCIRCPDPQLAPEEYLATYAQLREELVALFVRLFYDCLCSILLPPCPTPTDEDRVPLAAITVSPGECRVLQVCNWTRERKLLVTFPNLRYWLSWLPIGRMLREGLERMCCELELPQMQSEGTWLPPSGHRVAWNNLNLSGVAEFVHDTSDTAGTADETAETADVNRFYWAGSGARETVEVLMEGLMGRGISGGQILDSLMGVTGADGHTPLPREILDNLPQLLLLNRLGRPALGQVAPLMGALAGGTSAATREIATLRQQVRDLSDRLDQLESHD